MEEISPDRFRDELKRLTEKFHENLPRFREERFDEASLRIDYLAPFWRALGWDIENVQNRPQSLREVQVETRFYDDRRKRADYVFRTDGIDRFVCEAKGPLEELNERGAYQSQRYAYNLGVRIATLTNFAKFQVFILGGRPYPDEPWDAWKQWHYTEFLANADEIWKLFSRPQVGVNSLENTIAALPKRAVALPGGRQGWPIVPDRVRPVDEDFLEFIEQKRAELATDLLKNNTQRRLNEYDLNEAVQRVINRILFTRICEDRDIDTGRTLEGLLADYKAQFSPKETLYEGLVRHFNRLDKVFNGSLFKVGHFSENLTVSDTFLAAFVSELSSEDSPYLFSTLPIEILGSVYERFLGKTLSISGVKHVTLELKPELRKLGGIYYTPKYVVDYIVEKTLDPLLEGKSPKQVLSLKIVDIACGSGSFLIRALERICEYLTMWYQNNPEKQDRKACYVDKGELRLTTHMKDQVVLSTIYGLDIDQQAVEITMLSLYLKVLEGETRTTLLQQHAIPGLETEKYLPDLNVNVYCGNAIIGTEYYSATLGLQDSEYVRHQVNPFDWRKNFKAAVAQKGFDAVIGNPPYRRELDHKQLMDDIAECEFGSRYRAPRMDLWYYFVHRGLNMLRPKGELSFITNSYWTSGTGAAKLIADLKENCYVEEMFFLGKLKIFQDVSGQHMIFRLRKTTKQGPTLLKFALGTSTRAEDYVRGIVPTVSFTKEQKELFREGIVDVQTSSSDLLTKLDKNHPLASFGKVRQGIAENPASINKRTNEKHRNRWTTGEGVFALTPKELRALHLPPAEVPRPPVP